MEILPEGNKKIKKFLFFDYGLAKIHPNDVFRRRDDLRLTDLVYVSTCPVDYYIFLRAFLVSFLYLFGIRYQRLWWKDGLDTRHEICRNGFGIFFFLLTASFSRSSVMYEIGGKT